ncbi:DUF2905 domain-containing protein [Gilvimarinus sp. F26214L]|uniref:DUF2905 domain-containing protein n=1 Tax=Gilvimarinus sp. DZF01 TaxID=3461371 RepID=UPI004045D963
MAKLFIILGATLLGLGVLLYYFPKALSWFGRLPGDIRVEGEHGGFYFPITSMIIISIILSLISFLFRR